MECKGSVLLKPSCWKDQQKELAVIIGAPLLIYGMLYVLSKASLFR
jgi:hypothetical protein